MPSVRRLTAILAADVAGYSRLMGADEEGTHERLKAHLRELIEPKIAEHRGRMVKNTGDGFLAEFASVVDAVRCAVEILGPGVPNIGHRAGEQRPGLAPITPVIIDYFTNPGRWRGRRQPGRGCRSCRRAGRRSA